MKPLSEMNLIDNFLATVSMGHKKYGREIVGKILKPIIGREIRIKEVNVEKPVFPAEPGKHGVRLDAYVVEDKGEASVEHGNIYDLEPDQNKADREILPLRSRFYHYMIDRRVLESGESYGSLPDAWVIFIVSYDPFGMDRMLYTIRNQCVEEPGMKYNDRSTTLILYVSGSNTENCSKELQELLRYMNESTENNACNIDLMEIHEYITNIKAEPETREGYVMWSAYIDGLVRDATRDEKERADEAEKRADEAEKHADEVKKHADEAEKRADEAEKRADEAEKRADAAERKLREYEKKYGI